VNKKLKILFFCMIVVGGAAFAQVKPVAKVNLLLFLQPSINNWQQAGLKKSSSKIAESKPFLPADFYSKQLGFFCKQEIKMDKVTKFPIRFRLGTVEQCNWLEGKTRQ
jgi:hypothetical protein